MFEKVSDTTRRNFMKGAGATAAAAAAAFVGKSVFSAHAAGVPEVVQSSTVGAKTNILLVHGAFADASSWNKVIPLLQKQGFNVLAVQNPNTSLEDDIATTNQALASLSGNTILVGHSYGGVVIGNMNLKASKNAKVTGLVYISAFALDVTETVQSIATKYPAPASEHLVASYRTGCIWIDPAYFAQDFVQDISSPDANILLAVQKPLAPECFGTPSGAANWKSLPSWYLVSKNDRTINPDAERFMAKRMKATTREIASSHASPASHPNDVYKLILEAARGAAH